MTLLLLCERMLKVLLSLALFSHAQIPAECCIIAHHTAPRTQISADRAHSNCALALHVMLAVLVKWKSLGLSTLLEREREQQELLIAASGGVASKARSTDDLERLLVPFDA